MTNDDEPKHGFQGVWIPAALWNNSELTWMERCLAAEIDSLSSAEYGPCHASCEFLAARMGSASAGAMRKMLSDLIQKGVIWQLGSDGRRTWRCVAPLYSNDQGKYQRWAQHPRYEQALAAGVTGRSHLMSPPAHTEIPVEIPVKKDTQECVYKNGKEEVTKKEERHIGQRPLPGLSHYEDPKPGEDHPRGMPSLDQIKSETTRLGLPASDAEHLYDFWRSNGFKTGGAAVKSWTAVISMWNRSKYFPSQKAVKAQPGELMTNDILDALAQNPAYKKVSVQAEAWKFKEWCERTGNRPLVTSFIKSLNAKL